MSGAEILRTDRLVLSEATANDAAFVLELLNSRGFIEGIADRGIRTLEEARGYVEDRLVGSYRQHGFGMWLVTPKDGGQPVGLAGLVKRDVLEHPDVGYAFLEHAWGRGYAQEAAAGVLRHAREVLGLATVAGITNPDNHASRHVLEKVGLTYVGDIDLPGWAGPSAYFTT